MEKKILVIGTFDSKKEEYEYLVAELHRMGMKTIGLDVGVFSTGLSGLTELIPSTTVLAAASENDNRAEGAGKTLEQVQADNDRGQAMKLMANGAAVVARKLLDEKKISGVIGMGGSGGSSVISAAMQNLPIGLPKVLLSTMAGGNTQAYIGSKDVVMIPSITDIAGLNRISRTMITSAAAAVAGMAREATFAQESSGKQVIAVSMFGNTTDCVDHCRELLENENTEVVVFHATGTGGRTMESLIQDGLIDACLDITTTEIADEVCGGILSAGPNRLAAAGQRGIPHLVVPGCIDMANFGARETIPEKYLAGDRNLYEWNPSITLMRTNVEENVRMAEIFATHLNAAQGPVEVLIPLRGVSILDGDGERFCDREADQAMFQTLKSKLDRRIKVTEMDNNINDPEFAAKAVEIFQAMMSQDVETSNAQDA